MKKGRVTVDLIKKEAISLFLSHGFNKTSMSDIADACMIKKASLYHHIKNREMLLILVVTDTCQLFMNELRALNDKQFTSDKYLQQFIKLSKSFFQRDGGGFLIMKLVCEIGESIPDVKRVVAGFSQYYIKELTKLLEVQQDKSLAKKTAENIFAQINGALLLSTLEGHGAVLNKVWRMLKAL